MRGPVGLDGREFKLLIDAACFPGAASERTAKAFWTRRLKPIVEKRLDAKASGRSRAKGALRLKKQRLVAFLDSRDGLLDERHFSLRLRSTVEEGVPVGVSEVTLKFRTPDFLLAAEYLRVARRHAGETKLEEDIAPLQVAREGKPVAVPEPRSVYSRYSVSTKLAFDGRFETLGEVFNRFGALRDNFDRDGVAVEDAKLVPGPTIYEWVYQYAQVDLGNKLDAEFGFTLWYIFPTGGTRNPWKRATSSTANPRIAEISFDFATKDGRMNRAAAQRASTLFLAMQNELDVNWRETSKTALGLPAGA